MNRREQLWVLRRCGRKGHEVAWLNDSLSPEFEGCADDGIALLRCLRCATFVPNTAASVEHVYGQQTDPAPLADIPLVVRGSYGRKLAVLRLVAAERGVRAIGLLLAAIVVLAISANRDTVVAKADALITSAGPLAAQLGWDIQHSHTLGEVIKLLGSSATAYLLVAAALIAYGCVQIVEAVGLWNGFRWAEYLAAIATSVFLPVEIFELADHPTGFKAALLVINIAIVVYIVYKGRLFGLRGGHTQFLAEIRNGTLLGESLAAHGRNPAEQTGSEFV